MQLFPSAHIDLLVGGEESFLVFLLAGRLPINEPSVSAVLDSVSQRRRLSRVGVQRCAGLLEQNLGVRQVLGDGAQERQAVRATTGRTPPTQPVLPDA